MAMLIHISIYMYYRTRYSAQCVFLVKSVADLGRDIAIAIYNPLSVLTITVAS